MRSLCTGVTEFTSVRASYKIKVIFKKFIATPKTIVYSLDCNYNTTEHCFYTICGVEIMERQDEELDTRMG